MKIEKSLSLLVLLIVILGCSNKEVILNGGTTLSKEESKQEQYVKEKNERLNKLDIKIKKYDRDSRRDLKSMGTIPQ